MTLAPRHNRRMPCVGGPFRSTQVSLHSGSPAFTAIVVLHGHCLGIFCPSSYRHIKTAHKPTSSMQNYSFDNISANTIWRETERNSHLSSHLSFKGRWGTTDDFATRFFHFFPVFHCPLGLGELQACPFPNVVFPPLSLSALSSFPFHCALQDGFG